MSTKSDEQYRWDMDFPMELLAEELYGIDGKPTDDCEIVTHAAAKIRMLKKMILATGFSEQMLKACMEE